MSRVSNKHLVSGEFKKIRLKVLARDGYVCAYCGQEANQVDHIVAIANGVSASVIFSTALTSATNGSG